MKTMASSVSAESAPTVALLDQKIAEVEKTLLELKRQRNRLLPINRLPHEVLSTILKKDHPQTAWITENLETSLMARSGGDSDSFLGKIKPDTAHLRRVVGVCHAWRDLCLHSATFWNDLCCTDTPEWVALHLNRSKETLLSVRFNGRKLKELKSTSGLRNAFTHSHRFETLQIFSQPRLEHALSAHLKKPIAMTRLKTLSIQGGSRSVTHLPSDFLTANLAQPFPQLQRLELMGCHLSRDSALLMKSITSLRISHSAYGWDIRRVESPLRLPQLLDALARLPNLTHLHLYFQPPLFEAASTSEPDTPPPPRVHLPALQHFELITEMDCIIPFLNSIQAASSSGSSQLRKVRLDTHGTRLVQAKIDTTLNALYGAMWSPRQVQDVPGDSSISPMIASSTSKTFIIKSLSIVKHVTRIDIQAWASDEYPRLYQLHYEYDRPASDLHLSFIDNHGIVFPNNSSLSNLPIDIERLEWLELTSFSSTSAGWDWKTVVSSFTSLRHLHIDEVFAKEFIGAILDHPMPPGELWLPALEELHIRIPDHFWSVDMIEKLMVVLSGRGRSLKLLTVQRFVERRLHYKECEAKLMDGIDCPYHPLPHLEELAGLVDEVQLTWWKYN